MNPPPIYRETGKPVRDVSFRNETVPRYAPSANPNPSFPQSAYQQQPPSSVQMLSNQVSDVTLPTMGSPGQPSQYAKAPMPPPHTAATTRPPYTAAPTPSPYTAAPTPSQYTAAPTPSQYTAAPAPVFSSSMTGAVPSPYDSAPVATSPSESVA